MINLKRLCTNRMIEFEVPALLVSTDHLCRNPVTRLLAISFKTAQLKHSALATKSPSATSEFCGARQGFGFKSYLLLSSDFFGTTPPIAKYKKAKLNPTVLAKFI